MSFYLKSFVASVVILFALDIGWLGFVMKDFNTQQLAPIARMKDGSIDPLKAPALITYAIMAVALTAFAALSIIDGTWLSCLGKGALLGFCIYAVYDLTNLAVLKDYPVAFACADIGWGIVSYGLTTMVLFFARGLLI